MEVNFFGHLQQHKRKLGFFYSDNIGHSSILPILDQSPQYIPIKKKGEVKKRRKEGGKKRFEETSCPGNLTMTSS